MTDDRGQTMAIRGNKGACPLGATEDRGQRTEDRRWPGVGTRFIASVELRASIPGVQSTFHQLHDIQNFRCKYRRVGSFKEAFRRPEGPNRSPMPWGLAAGGKGVQYGC